MKIGRTDYTGMEPVHCGYLVQPQNWLPGFRPLFAVRRAIMAPQTGHCGEGVGWLSFGEV